MIGAGGLSGGLSSAIAGGNFWDGMRQGLIASALNHAMHRTFGKENQPPKRKEEEKKITGVLQSDTNLEESPFNSTIQKGLTINSSINGATTLTEAIIVAGQKISDPKGKYPLITKLPLLTALSKITNVINIAEDYSIFLSNPIKNAWNGVKAVGGTALFFAGGVELQLAISVGFMTIDASEYLLNNYSTQPKLVFY